MGSNPKRIRQGRRTPAAIAGIGLALALLASLPAVAVDRSDGVKPAAPRAEGRDREPCEGAESGPATLEDIFGDTGSRFQASVGLLNLEGQSGNPASSGFGLAIDDMFVEWVEFTRDPDRTECAAGQCAVLEVPSALLYEGVTSLAVSLLDATPYGHACVGGANAGRVCFAAEGATGNPECPAGLCAPAANDCDLDGSFDGPGDDEDCNDNGTPDVVALATSEADFGEIVVLDRVAAGSPEYRGEVAVSVLADSEGVLYLVQVGDDEPTVVVTYRDEEDGTGRACQNDLVTENRGRVQTATTVSIQFCDVSVVSTSFADNGDSDLFADSSETVELSFAVQNRCGFPLTDCVARLSSNSPAVECIKQGTVSLGGLPAGTGGGAGPVIDAPSPFVFKLDDVQADRTSLGLGPDDALSASFNVAISCTEIDGLTFPQNFSLALDLNLNDAGQIPTVWREDFEGGGTNPANPLQGTSFVAQNNDAAVWSGMPELDPLRNANGWRCQYSDPDWINGNAYNDSEAEVCYPGLNLAHANAVFWQVDGSGVAASPDGGRAYRGEKSMYYGVFLGQSDENFTSPLGTVEAAATEGLINLGVGNPRLSFWQQISLADWRSVGTPTLRSNVDRGVVQVRVHDVAGDPIGDWINLQPVQNAYDQQAAANYFNCMFDPVDDGNTEDDFFDPTDPDRSRGPSSTCFPTFTWAWMGSTTGAFSTENVGYATTPPASSDEPDLGLGTWIESVVDLSELRGRRVKLRYLVAGLKAPAETHVGLFGPDRDERDDGWWLDEIEISETLADPATLENDDYTLGRCSVSGQACINQCEFGLQACADDSDCGVNELCLRPCPVGQTCLPNPPDCGPVCTSVTANAFVLPAGELNPGTVTLPVPGQAVTILGAAPADPQTGALPSTADACLSGSLQYRFCRDGDPLGEGPNAADGDCDDGWDRLLRGWTENAVLTVAPQATAGYTMEVRCSRAPACADSELVQVSVGCPGAANALGLKALRWADASRLEWSGAPLVVDYWIGAEYGNSAQLAGYPGATSTSAGAVSFLDLGAVSPSPGTAVAVLVKADGPLNTIPSGYYCNSVTWRSGGTAEIPESGFPGSAGRDASIGGVP